MFFGSRDLPFEGCGEVEGAARRKHFTLCQHIVQPVSTRYTLPISICLQSGDHVTVICPSCDGHMSVTDLCEGVALLVKSQEVCALGGVIAVHHRPSMLDYHLQMRVCGWAWLHWPISEGLTSFHFKRVSPSMHSK